MSLMKLFLVPVLILNPKRFIEIATDDVIKKEFQSNQQLLQQYPNKVLPRERRSEFNKGIEETSLQVRGAIVKSFWSLVVVILGALFFSYILKLLDRVTAEGIFYVRLISISLIFWSVWGRLGWEIQTAGGNTLPEIINRNWAKALYLMGIFATVTAYCIQDHG